ncbi:MAG: PAS domain S-box protein [Candidatus Omnitrophica bacterium]|nr:PAS domain S-box protein [Candidatus Omnitrophota bacterium]
MSLYPRAIRRTAELSAALRQLRAQRLALDKFAVITETDAQGRILSVNNQFCLVSQYTREEVLGKDHREVVGSGHHPKAFWRQMWDTISRGEVWRGDVKNRAKDGSLYWLDTTIVPMLGADGKPEKYLAIRVLITDRKRAEEQLGRLAAIVESSEDAIISTTLEGIVTSWNRGAERLYGYTAEEMLGGSVACTIPPGRSAERGVILERVMRGESTNAFETIRMRKDGRRIQVSLTVSPVKNAEGAIIGASAIVRDITEHKRLETLKDEFVSTISHELRTPLAIIREGISLILDHVPGPLNEKQQRVMITAQSNIDRLARIINDLLDMSRLESGQTELKKERIDVAALIQEALATFQARASQRGLVLKASLPPSPLYAYADRDKAIQIITNLVSNALKFTAQGHVEVSVQSQEGHIVCAVADTGRGISKEDLPRVFSKFQQFGRTPGAGEKGTGLGLAIVKSLVELHGGTIWVESQANQGTTFTFTLPVYSAEVILAPYVEQGIRAAEEHSMRLSLLTVTVPSLNGLPPMVPREGIEDVERTMKEHMRCRGDTIIRIPEGIAVLLEECSQSRVAQLRARLVQMLQQLPADASSPGAVWTIGCATYPDDTKQPRALIVRAMRRAADPALVDRRSLARNAAET